MGLEWGFGNKSSAPYVLAEAPFILRPILYVAYYLFPIGDWIAFILAGAYSCLPTVAILVPIFVVYNKKLHKSVPEYERALREVEENEKALVGSIYKYIMYVPPKYRTSEALSYFVESYENSRVSNLQQAVIEYDKYARHQEEMGMLRMVVQMLEMIAYQQVRTQEQLNDICSYL